MADAPLAAQALAERAGRRRPALGYALVLAAVTLWAVNAAVAKVVIEAGDLSPLRLAEVRATGSAVVLFGAVALLRPGKLRLVRREALILAVFGICGLAFVHFFYFVAISHLDIGIALVIQYVAPVLVAVWARFFEHEPVRRRLWWALAICLGGLSLVTNVWGGGRLDAVGVAACLAAALSYAFYILVADHRLRAGADVYSLLAWGFVFAALFWAVVQPWWSFPGGRVTQSVSLLGRLAETSAPVGLLLAYIVVFGTVVPFVLMVSSLHHIAPTRATIVAMAEPVLGGLVGFIWLAEEIGPAQIVGGTLVLLGILLAQTARSAASR